MAHVPAHLSPTMIIFKVFHTVTRPEFDEELVEAFCRNLSRDERVIIYVLDLAVLRRTPVSCPRIAYGHNAHHRLSAALAMLRQSILSKITSALHETKKYVRAFLLATFHHSFISCTPPFAYGSHLTLTLSQSAVYQG